MQQIGTAASMLASCHGEHVVPAAFPPALAKSARMGHPLFGYAKEERSMKDGPPANDRLPRMIPSLS